MDDAWRLGCVTRARPVAADTRFVEIVLSGPPVSVQAGATVDILTGRGAIHSFACLPARPGSLRILVPRAEGPAQRFMWALIEGARLKVRLPAGIVTAELDEGPRGIVIAFPQPADKDGSSVRRKGGAGKC